MYEGVEGDPTSPGGAQGRAVIGGKTVGKQIRISLVGSSLSAVADLFEEPNGNIAEAIWEAAPYRTISLHNVVSGKNMYSFRPVVEPNFGFTPTTTRRMAAEP